MENAKLEACKKCWGTGHVHGGDEKSSWSKTCEDCHGIGFVRVPKTNADRIRAMSDEELAMQFANFEYRVAKEVLAKFGIDITTEEHNFEAAAADMLEQLQQPVED